MKFKLILHFFFEVFKGKFRKKRSTGKISSILVKHLNKELLKLISFHVIWLYLIFQFLE